MFCIHLHCHRPSDLKGDYIILSWRYISSAWNKAYGSTVHSHCIIATSRKTSHKHSFHHDSKKSPIEIYWFEDHWWIFHHLTQTTEFVHYLGVESSGPFSLAKAKCSCNVEKKPHWSEVYQPYSTNGSTTAVLILLFSLLCLVLSPVKPATDILYKLSGKKILLRTFFFFTGREGTKPLVHICLEFR